MRRGWFLALWILLGLFGYWVIGTNIVFMRPDEELVYRHTGQTFGYTIWYQAARDVQAPLWHSLFWSWRQVTGITEFAGRYFGVLISAVTLAVVYRIGRSWFGAPKYGYAAMLIVGTNAYFFTYALEIRPYPLAMLAGSTCMLAYWHWLRQGKRRAALWYGASLALIAYTHYFMAFLVAMQVLYLALSRPSRERWLQFGWVASLGLILWLPWMPVFVAQVRRLLSLTGDLGISSTALPTSARTIEQLVQLATNGWPWIYAGVFLGGMLILRGLRARYVLLVLWGCGAPALALLLNNFASVYAPRYLSYASVGLGIAAGIGLVSLPFRWLQAGAVLALFTVNLVYLPQQMPNRVQYRTVFREVSAVAEPGDVIFWDMASESGRLVTWQAAEYLAPHLRENAVTKRSALGDARRVWHVTGEWFDETVQANFQAVEARRPLQRVIGQCDRSWCYLAQLLEGPPSFQPVARITTEASELLFYGADVERQPNGIRAWLWWRVDDALTRDYSVSVQLLDANGVLIAQADGPPNDQYEGITQTSQLVPGRPTIDVRRLDAALGTGQYTLVAVVYRPWDGTRLTTENGDDTLLLDTITVP